MRKLTPQEQQWVEYAYPLVKQAMDRYNLSENDSIDWHGELSVALCEAVMEISPYSFTSNSIETFIIRWTTYAAARIEDRIHFILNSNRFPTKEIPSGLRPHKAAGRRRSL